MKPYNESKSTHKCVKFEMDEMRRDRAYTLAELKALVVTPIHKIWQLSYSGTDHPFHPSWFVFVFHSLHAIHNNGISPSISTSLLSRLNNATMESFFPFSTSMLSATIRAVWQNFYLCDDGWSMQVYEFDTKWSKYYLKVRKKRNTCFVVPRIVQ